MPFVIHFLFSEFIHTEELSLSLIPLLLEEYPGVIAGRYDVAEEGSAAEVLGNIAEKRKCITKGGELDLAKAATLVVDEFRNGKIGRFTIELPQKTGQV